MPIEPIVTEKGKGRPAILNGGSGGGGTPAGGIAGRPAHPDRGAAPFAQPGLPAAPAYGQGPSQPVRHNGKPSGSPLK